MNRADRLLVGRGTVAACQAAIVLTGTVWLRAGDWPSAAVAAGALLLTLLAARPYSGPAGAVRAAIRPLLALLVAVLLAAHVVLGMALQLYETSVLYDKLMHVIGSAAIAAVLIVAVRSFCSRQRIALPALLLASLIFSGTLSAGALWEIFEFAVDRTGLFVAQRGLGDTMIDLIADALGAMLSIAAFLWLVDRRRGPGELIKGIETT